MGNTLAFSRRVPAILTATFATSALGFLALTASLSSFAEVRAKPGEILFFADATTTAITTVTTQLDNHNNNYFEYSSNDDDWYNKRARNRENITRSGGNRSNSTLHHEYPIIVVPHQKFVQSVPILESTYIGILQGNEYYDDVLQGDLMYTLSQACLLLSFACGGLTTTLAWALSTIYPPTDTNWKLLGVIGAISAVVQMPMFLLFETDPCTEYPNHQQCDLSYGSFFLILSTVFWSAITLATQCLDPPLWAVELNAWRVKDEQIDAEHNNQIDTGAILNQSTASDAVVVHRRTTDTGEAQVKQHQVIMQLHQQQKHQPQQQQQQTQDEQKSSFVLTILRNWVRQRWANSDGDTADHHMDLPQVQTESLSLPEDASPKFAETDSYYARSNCSRLLLQVLPNGKRPGDDAKSVTTFGDLDSIVKLAEEGRLNDDSNDTFQDEDHRGSQDQQNYNFKDQDQRSPHQTSLVIVEESQTSGESSGESPGSNPVNATPDNISDISNANHAVTADACNNDNHETDVLPDPNKSDVDLCNDWKSNELSDHDNDSHEGLINKDNKKKPIKNSDKKRKRGKNKRRRINMRLRGGTNYQKLGSPPSTPNSRQSSISMITDRLRQGSTRLRYSASKTFPNATENQEKDEVDYIIPADKFSSTNINANDSQEKVSKRLSDSEQQLLDDWNTLHKLLESGGEKHLTVVAPETSFYSTDDDDRQLLLSNYVDSSSVNSFSTALQQVQSDHCSHEHNDDNHSISSASSESSLSGRIITHETLEQKRKESRPINTHVPTSTQINYNTGGTFQCQGNKRVESYQNTREESLRLVRSHSAPELANGENSCTTSSQHLYPKTNSKVLHQSYSMSMVVGNIDNDSGNGTMIKIGVSDTTGPEENNLVGRSSSLQHMRKSHPYTARPPSSPHCHPGATEDDYNSSRRSLSPGRPLSTSSQQEMHHSNVDSIRPGSPFSTNLSTIPKNDTTFAASDYGAQIEADISNSIFNNEFSTDVSFNFVHNDKHNNNYNNLGDHNNEEKNYIDSSNATNHCKKKGDFNHSDGNDGDNGIQGDELFLSQPRNHSQLLLQSQHNENEDKVHLLSSSSLPNLVESSASLPSPKDERLFLRDVQPEDNDSNDSDEERSIETFHSLNNGNSDGNAHNKVKSDGVNAVQYAREARIRRLQHELIVTRRRSKTQEPPLNRRIHSSHFHHSISENDHSSLPSPRHHSDLNFSSMQIPGDSNNSY